MRASGLLRGRRTALSALLTAAAACAAAALAAPAFAPLQIYPVGAEGQSVAIADVTGDGHADVLLTDTTRLFVFQGSARGSLAKPIVLPLAGPGATEWNAGLAVADVNRDGRADVAVAGKSGVRLFVQRRGRFAPSRDIPLPFTAVEVTAADLNGDRRPDLVVSGRIEQVTAPELYLLMNGRSGWHAQKIDDYWSMAICIGDVNGDGHPDIVPLPPGTTATPSVRLYLGDGRGNFARRDIQVASQPVDAPSALAVGDVTGDGRADLVFVNDANSPRSHLAVMAGGSSGSLAAPTLYPSYDTPDAVAIADLNGDRRNDIAVLHGGFKKLGIYYQGPAGSLGAEQLTDIPYSSRFNPNALAIGNIDAGRHPDIAIADNGYTKGLLVLRQP
jgi:hypothetical protein